MCAVRLFLGIPCPGCGLLHALFYLCLGDWKESFSCHPMGVAFLFWVACLGMQKAGWFRMSSLTNQIVAHSVLAGFFVTWLTRLI